MKPHILITNDDGIQAEGIRHLWDSLRAIADITIVAPTQEQSGKATSITIHDPLHVRPYLWSDNQQAWSVTGTPADCIKLALSAIVKNPPDLIVSGINAGTNAGRHLLYSGTVGGTIEGILQDIPSIAFSCHSFYNPNYPLATPFIPSIVQHILEHPLPHGTLLNVNFPDEEVKGIKLTRQGKEHWKEDPHERSNPVNEGTYYWLGGKKVSYEEEPDSDIAWLAQGYATAVPIHIAELTDHRHLKEHKALFEAKFAPEPSLT